MVAGMVLGLLSGKSFTEMAQYGVAYGASTTMQPETKLCQNIDVQKIYNGICLKSKKMHKLT